MFRSRLGRGRTAALCVGLFLSGALSLFLGYLSWEMTRSLSAAGETSLLAEWTHIVFFLSYLVLVLVPVLGFSSHEFYDITRLFHLPVRHGTVFLAQTIGLLTSGTVLFLLPTLVALTIALPGTALLVPRLLLLALFVFHSVALSQMLQLLLLNTLRSRRFRDLAAVFAAVLTASAFLSFRFMMETGDPQTQILRLLSGDYSRYLLPLPCRWISDAVAPGAELSQAAPFIGASLAVTGLIVIFAVALQMAAFHGVVPSARLKPATAARRSGRAGRLLRRIPAKLRALAGREFLLLRREPAVKSLLIQQSVFVIVPTLLWMLGVWGHYRGSTTTLVAWGGYLLLLVESTLAFNMLGLEGNGIVQLLMTPVRRGALLGGKVLAYFVLFAAANLSLVAIVAAVSAAAGRGVRAEVVAGSLLGVLASILVLLGVGGPMSALFPGRLTAQGRRALGQSGGHGGCLVTIAWFGGLGLAALLILPVHLLTREPLLMFLAPAYGLAVLVLGLRLGARILRRREEWIVTDLRAKG